MRCGDMQVSRLFTWSIMAAIVIVAGVAAAQSGEVTVLSDPDDDGRVCPTAAHFVVCTGDTEEDAPPALELVSVTFEETPHQLIVRMKLDGLEEDLRDVAGYHDATNPHEGGTGQHAAQYTLCWDIKDGGCGVGLYLWFQSVDGEPVARSGFNHQGPSCDDVIPCQYHAPYTIHTGSPGVIEWQLPRTLLPGTDAGDTIDDAVAYVLRSHDNVEPFRVFLGSGDGSFYVTNFGNYEGNPEDAMYNADSALDSRPFTFDTEAEEGLSGLLALNRFADPKDDFNGPERPDLDILEGRFGVEDGHLIVSVKKALVRENPEDHSMYFNFGFNDEVPFIQATTWAEDGARQFAATRWLEFPSDGPEDYTEMSASMDVAPGEPGWVNVSIPLDEAPIIGERVAWTWLGATDHTEWGETEGVNEALGPLDAGLSRFQWDLAGPGTAWRVSSDAELPANVSGEDPTRLTVADDVGDANLPSEASMLASLTGSGDPEGSYDVTRVRADAIDDGLIEVSLEVQDLVRPQVPEGYDAVLYGVAVQTTEGKFLAVAEYRDDAAGMDDLTEEWYCTADTSVLTETPRIPGPGIPIDGFLRPSQASQGSDDNPGTSQPATLRWTMPRECLGDAAPGPFEVEALGGGSFLVQDRPGGESEATRVDGAQDEMQRMLEPPEDLDTASTAAPGAEGGLGAPFGFDGFWDVTGIVVGVMIAAVGGVLVRRRRNVLKEYLREIDALLDEHEDDPSGLEASLRDLHGEAKADLVNGRLTENQYVVIKDRVTEEMSQAHVQGLTEAFGELPHQLLKRLQEMAQDGTISPEDRRLFSTLLEDSALTGEAKERVRRKLDVWEDAGEAGSP